MKRGLTEIIDAKRGTTQINKIMRGVVLIWEKVADFYNLFKQRVLSDGGTFIENPIVFNNESLLLTPNAFKAGKLYSALPTNSTGDFTVDRNSTATYIGQDGLIKTALANVPRIDWSTGVPVILRGLQRTNLVPYSEVFSNSWWLKMNTTIAINTTISPEGTMNASKIVEGTINDKFRLYKNFTGITDISTSSIYIKKAGRSKVKFYGNGATNNSYMLIDLSNGTAYFVGSEILDYNIEAMPNDWYRITATNDDYWLLYVYLLDDNWNETYQGDGVSGIYVWGAQIEVGTEASSYIPTAGVTETRLADDISVPTPAGVTSITETIEGVDQTPITTIPATYSLPVGNINKVTML